MTSIIAAGFAIIDETAIWGVGATEVEAWADFTQEMIKANLKIVETLDTIDLDNRDGMAARDQFRCEAATAALMAQVRDEGGCIAWGNIGDIACTEAEGNTTFAE